MEQPEHRDSGPAHGRRPWVIVVTPLAVVLLWLAAFGTAAAAPAIAPPPLRELPAVSGAQSYVVPYQAWNGQPRESVLLLPADYSPDGTESLPCIVLAHPRGGNPYATAAIWGDLPTRLRFAVLCAGSAGRRATVDSWAYSGQLQDLMDLPDLVTQTMPWVQLDRDRLYVAGVSMGGTEALCLLALNPDRIAAAASFDGVADLAAYYYHVPLSRRAAYQALLRREVGGSPRQARFGYRVRSPLTFARNLATAGVPFSVWWSTADRSVPRQAQDQSGKLCRTVRRLSAQAPLTEHVTRFPHGYALQADPLRLLRFLKPGGHWRTRRDAPPSRWTYASWLPAATVWGYRFTTDDGLTRLWRATVSKGKIQVSTPAPLQVELPYVAADGPANVVLNGRPSQVWPRRGLLDLQFPEGTSTALIDP